MVTSCPQNNVTSTDMQSNCNLATPHRTGYRDLAQTAAPRSPPRTRMIKTPVPRLRSNAVRLSTPRTALREDLDRFIPSRRRMNMELCRRKLNSASKPREESSSVACAGPAADARVAKLAYKKELLSTMCNVPTSALDDELQLKSLFQYGTVSPPKTGNRRSVVAAAAADPFAMDFLRSLSSSCTIFQGSQPIAVKRAISSRPEKIFDAPMIVNDYYTHPLSWSKDNVLAVALGSSVYLMNVATRSVQEIAGAGITSRTRGAGSGTPNDDDDNNNYVRSVKWCTMDGLSHLLAVGTSAGVVRVYDTISSKEVVHMSVCSDGSPLRALSWNESRQWLSAGCATGKIVSLDVRSCSVTGVTQSESRASSVCNLAWNVEGTCLASGRNDNAIHLWDASMMHSATADRGPRLVLESHTAAVKGLAWCPYRRDVLASGGGTADGCIKLWNACSGRLMKSACTGNQVSSLLWGQHHPELFSGHGYSSNNAVVWSYPKMEQVGTLSNHKGRILSMDLSPDGSKLASIGADELLCIWKVGAAPTRRDAAAFETSPSFGARFAIR